MRTQLPEESVPPRALQHVSQHEADERGFQDDEGQDPSRLEGTDRPTGSGGPSREMNALIQGSKLVAFPKSGHVTFVDQPRLFIEAVQGFLSTGK